MRPLAPGPARTRRSRADDRGTIEDILYVLNTGCRWKDLPREYGAPTTVWRRRTCWGEAGVWGRIWRAAPAAARGGSGLPAAGDSTPDCLPRAREVLPCAGLLDGCRTAAAQPCGHGVVGRIDRRHPVVVAAAVGMMPPGQRATRPRGVGPRGGVGQS